MKFNENLKYLRKREEMTQEELAEKLNVSRQSVTKWESGQSLPDIEKVKEIAYMFSVSVDALIGDIESKSTNKIKKKIDDIGWFISGLIIFWFAIIVSIHNFLLERVDNEDLTITITIILAIVAFISSISRIKSYLKENEQIILNMKDDEEGKKQRTKYIVKRNIIFILSWAIFCIINSLQFLVDENVSFLKEYMNKLIFGIIISLILGYFEYKSLEKKVKELNK